MRARLIAGIVLIVFGLAVLAYGGFSYTRRETILDLGPLEATAESQETVPIPPLVGGLSLAAGVILLVTNARRKGP